MSTTRISATELARSLSDVLNRVKYQGERFVIERGGEPIAELAGPFPSGGRTLKELAVLLGDLSLPGGGFGADLASVRAQQGEARNPWRS